MPNLAKAIAYFPIYWAVLLTLIKLGLVRTQQQIGAAVVHGHECGGPRKECRIGLGIEYVN